MLKSKSVRHKISDMQQVNKPKQMRLNEVSFLESETVYVGSVCFQNNAALDIFTSTLKK